MKQAESIIARTNDLPLKSNEIYWPDLGYSQTDRRIRCDLNAEGKPSCYLIRAGKDGSVYEVDFGEWLGAWRGEKIWTFIWEEVLGLFLDDDGITCDLKYLNVIAEAGLRRARADRVWPVLGFDLNRVQRFYKRLPEDARKEYLRYCLKEWNQRSSDVQQAHLETSDLPRVVDRMSFSDGYSIRRDFGEAIEEELTYVEALAPKPHVENAERIFKKVVWIGSQLDLTAIIEALRTNGLIRESTTWGEVATDIPENEHRGKSGAVTASSLRKANSSRNTSAGYNTSREAKTVVKLIDEIGKRNRDKQ